jgi:hypothetical protein
MAALRRRHSHDNEPRDYMAGATLGEFTPSYILHTHASGPIYWGVIYLAKKIIR